MDLMEYKAKEIFDKYGIQIQKGFVIDSVKDLGAHKEELRFPVVIKAQVQIGGRGKAGGIKFANDIYEVEEAATYILGMDINGHIVKKILILEKVEIKKEFYVSIILDRLIKQPVIIFCSVGGADIEETAKTHPEKIIKVSIDPVVGINSYIARYIVGKSSLDKSIYKELYNVLKKIYKMFNDYNCLLVEINPLAVSDDGCFIAVDGKVNIDDNALNLHSDILEYRDSLDEDELVRKARELDFLYIPCEHDGNIAVMSNGSGMVMSCMDLISKQNLKVGVAFDLGGGATSERIAQAVRIVLSNKKINTLLISIFGGITRCDEVAKGLKLAIENQEDDKLVVIRIEGTNKEEGLEILNNIKGNIVPVKGIREGVKELSERRADR